MCYRLAHSVPLVGLLLLAAVVGGCSSTRVARPAPVEDRPVAQARIPVAQAPAVGAPSAAARPSSAPAAVVTVPAAESAGTWVVKSGDTLIRIGLESGQNWRDIARWNNLENPNLIEVGQVLRVVPPVESAVAVAQPVSTPTATPVNVAPGSASATPRPAVPAATVQPAAPQPSASAPVSDEDIAWIWPANGPLLGGFDEARNKGLDIGGKLGDPVLAVADGRVVYAGAGLRGYGNLIILKHNNTFLTAYAHNQTLLVKEDQSVRKGQRIAEMGSTDSDRVKLHFEIRRQGKPVDPGKYLPPR